jgi:hypothetical protein
MNQMDKFEIGIIFKNISYLITNKITKLSDSSKANLIKSINFFNELIKSLDSLNYSAQINEKENNSYIFFPNLQELVSSVPNIPQNINKKEILFAKKYFLDIINQIENLKNDPEKFYAGKRSEQLKTLADKLALIHQENFYSHTFETEDTFSNSSFVC